MPATKEISPGGIEVELDQIEPQLKKLVEDSGGKLTRASLVNFAIYSEATDSLARNTELISQITERLACRAIIISVNRAAEKDRIQAWINAHCHAGSNKTKEVCSEQLSFRVEGPCIKLLNSMVFSHLDSDLPFYLWWQGEFHDPMDSELLSWVDRLIYDSQTWKNFGAQMRLLDKAQMEAKTRVILCDLNWARLTPIRVALAQFFDHPASRHHLTRFDRLEIDFASEHRSTALLLAGWIAAQLQWKPGAGELAFRNDAGQAIEVLLKEKNGAPISRCVLRNELKEFCVAHPANTDLLDVSSSRPGQRAMHQLMPAAKNDPVALLNEEFVRGGAGRIYLRALERVRELL
jgi:glucose-6-phosphate dehydrogenase assembly protein OpcA